jgi:hypothetical protein
MIRVHLLLALAAVLLIWAVIHPSTNWAQRFLTLVIKWVPICLTWHGQLLEGGLLKTIPSLKLLKINVTDANPRPRSGSEYIFIYHNTT